MATKTANGLYRRWYKGKQFYGKTDAEAKKKRDDYKYECEHGIEQVCPVTVMDYAEKWLPVAKAGVLATTYNQYATTLEILTGTIGDKLISAVTPSDIKLVWKHFVGKSQSYISKAMFLYKAMFQSAIENGHCKQNPVIAPSAKPHRGSKGTHRCLTAEEIRLIETVPHRCQTGSMFMLKAGLRRGEILALKKSDIHDEHIYITKAVKYVNNRPVVGKTKNVSSERQVPLFEPLKPFYESMQNLAMPDSSGNMCSETAFNRAWESYMHTLSKKAGHEISFRPHDCRHTFVSKARDAGIDIHIVMRWCGHSSERMILEIYDHPSEQREKNAIRMMNGTVKKQLKRFHKEQKPVDS